MKNNNNISEVETAPVVEAEPEFIEVKVSGV
jgi:hypothetical protein